jgi:hypothetical protein
MERLMKTWLLFFFILLFSACTRAEKPSSLSSQATYPDLGPAPDLVGDVWLNTDAPIHLASLKGKVVLLDMWTFG